MTERIFRIRPNRRDHPESYFREHGYPLEEWIERGLAMDVTGRSVLPQGWESPDDPFTFANHAMVPRERVEPEPELETPEAPKLPPEEKVSVRIYLPEGYGGKTLAMRVSNALERLHADHEAGRLQVRASQRNPDHAEGFALIPTRLHLTVSVLATAYGVRAADVLRHAVEHYLEPPGAAA